ncbi:MAG: hypothetical protein H0W12_07630 [Chitinophagaceae bacterium]|nr:hypothetical protein [Chitinophagaceae bacterium]
MKQLFLYALIVIFASCSSSNHIMADKKRPVGDAGWQIDEATANKMIKRLNKCGLRPCHNNFGIADHNRAERQFISASSDNKAEIDSVPARYRHKDERRYKENWGLEGQKDHYKVNGYKTWILKVTKSSGSMFFTTTYFDIYKICPPPLSGCVKPAQ